MSALLPWGWVRVSGQSMTPTLHDGDRVLVRYRAAVRPGLIVLAHFRGEPDRAVIKRVSEPRGPDWWLLSDNPRAGTDSRTLGPGKVHAIAVRLWPTGASRPGRRWPRLVGQRLPAAPPDGL